MKTIKEISMLNSIYGDNTDTSKLKNKEVDVVI